MLAEEEAKPPALAARGVLSHSEAQFQVCEGELQRASDRLAECQKGALWPGWLLLIGWNICVELVAASAELQLTLKRGADGVQQVEPESAAVFSVVSSIS